MVSSKQLFEGQTNHPLTEAEIEAFFEKVELRSHTSFLARTVLGSDGRGDIINFFKKSLEEAMKTPTGREQVREIIKSKDEFRVFGFNDSDPGLGGYNNVGSQDVYINLNNKYIHQPKKIGGTILHELLHARQTSETEDSKVLLDAETQALSYQLDVETKSSNQSVQYQKSFEYNKGKWLRIAKTGRYPKDFNGLKFKPVQGLSAEELKTAQEMYANQMASLETRAQATKDFSKPASEWGKNPSLKYPDYGLAAHRESYSMQDDYFYENSQKPIVSKKTAQDIVSRNPFLKESDFYSLWQEKSNEKSTNKNVDEKSKKNREVVDYFDYATLSKDKLTDAEKVINREQDATFKKISLASLEKLKKGRELSSTEKMILKHTFLFNLNDNEMRSHTKKIEMYDLIKKSIEENPKKNPLRTKIIKRTAKAVGAKELPIVQNEARSESDLLKTLNPNAVPYQEMPDRPRGNSSRERMA